MSKYERHGMSNLKEYNSWSQMKQRCLNKKHGQYKDYGARGITVCEEWMDFKSFYKDMGSRPKGMSLDRIDNSKGYCKENCRWANYSTQNKNKRTQKNSKYGFRGVCDLVVNNGKYKYYKAYINVNNKNINLGLYKKLEEAVKARKEAELKYWK